MADSAFSLMFLSRGSPSGTIAYVWANQTSTTDYAPHGSYQWPGGATIHRPSAGVYYVRLPGVFATNVNFQVTGYGDARCELNSWGADGGGTLVSVVCPDGDSRFNLLYLENVGPTGVIRPKAAYALVAPGGLDNTFPAASRYSSAGTTPTLTTIGVGDYVVTLPGMPRGGMALVTIWDFRDVACYVSKIRRNASPQKVGVKCADSDGVPAYAMFFLAYTK